MNLIDLVSLTMSKELSSCEQVGDINSLCEKAKKQTTAQEQIRVYLQHHNANYDALQERFINQLFNIEEPEALLVMQNTYFSKDAKVPMGYFAHMAIVSSPPTFDITSGILRVPTSGYVICTLKPRRTKRTRWTRLGGCLDVSVEQLEPNRVDNQSTRLFLGRASVKNALTPQVYERALRYLKK